MTQLVTIFCKLSSPSSRFPLFFFAIATISLRLKIGALEPTGEQLSTNPRAEEVAKKPREYKTLIQELRAKFYGTYALIAGLFVLVGLIAFNELKILGSNQIVTNFRQVKVICRPFLSSGGNDLIEASFASMKTRADYIVIMRKLDDLARSKGVSLPRRNDW